MAVVLVLGGLFAAAYLPRRSAQTALEASVNAADATPRVEVISPKATSSDSSLVLPGSIRPLEETVIYPRVSGYVRKWNADIGDKVVEGQVLAEIDAREKVFNRFLQRIAIALEGFDFAAFAAETPLFEPAEGRVLGVRGKKSNPPGADKPGFRWQYLFNTL